MVFERRKRFTHGYGGSLKKNRESLRTTDPDKVMIGEPNGDSFDRMIGAIRRPMLLEAIDIERYADSV